MSKVKDITEVKVQINTSFAAMQMIDVLFARGLINEATYSNILSHVKDDDREAA